MLGALRAAAADRKVLLVIDDAWQVEHERALFCLDEATGSACLVTTRIGALVKGYFELELMQLGKEAALDLLLKAGEVEQEEVAPSARAAALQAVELCGRLPLCLAIAGAMILEHADDWETWLVPALRDSHGAELRERSASVGDGAEEGSVEERVLRASLRSIKVEERVGVTALFDVCACFAEDATVPAAVFDALAPAIFEEVARAEAEATERAEHGDRQSLDAGGSPSKLGGNTQSRPVLKKGMSARELASSVRRWLREALRHSLLLGSIADGIRMHDLVRDYTIARAYRRDGGLGGVQLRVVSALLSAMPEAGFVDLTFAAEADKGTQLSFYVSQQLSHHLSGAFLGEGGEDGGVGGESASLLVGGRLHPTVSSLFDADEPEDKTVMMGHLLRAVGKEQLQAAAGELEATATTAVQWMDVGRLFRASLEPSKGGTPLREGSLKAIASFKKVHDPPDGPAPDEALAKLAREIEARTIVVLTMGVGTGFTRGSDEHVEMMAHNEALGAAGSVIAGSTKEQNAIFPAMMGFMALCLAGPKLERPELLNWNTEEHLELLVEGVRTMKSLATDWPYTLNAVLKTPAIKSLFAKWPLVKMSKVPTLEEKRAWVSGYMCATSFTEVAGRFHLFGANHPVRAEINALYGEKGARLRNLVTTYDISFGVDVKRLWWQFDPMVTGMAGFSLALRFGDLDGAKQDWTIASESCQAIMRAIQNGIIDYQKYAMEFRLLRTARTVAIAMGDVGTVRALFENTFEGRAARDAYVAVMYQTSISRPTPGLLLGHWKHELEGVGEVCYNMPKTQMFVAKALAALLDAAADGADGLIPDVAAADAGAFDGLNEWLPSADELLDIAQREYGWDHGVFGLQHPALLGAALYLGSGRARTADDIATQTLDKHLVTPINRVEAMRLVAKCRIALGKPEEAAALLAQAIVESKEAGYLLLEVLVARDRLALLRSLLNKEGVGSRVKDVEAALVMLKQAAVQMHSGADAIFGEGGWE